MKKKNQLSELTLEELNKKKSSQGAILSATVIVTLILCIVLLYLIAKGRNIALIGVIPACLLMTMPGIIRLSQIKAEIKSRHSTAS